MQNNKEFDLAKCLKITSILLRTHFASQGQTKKIRNFVESLSRVKIKSVNSKADFWISQNSNTVDYIFYTRVLINMLSSEGALIFDLCVNYDIDN